MKSKTLAIYLWFIVWGTGVASANDLQLVWQVGSSSDGKWPLYSASVNNEDGTVKEKRLVAATTSEGRIAPVRTHGKRILYMESLAPAKAEGTELRPKHILFGWENSQKTVLTTNPDLHGENNGMPLDYELSHSGRYIAFIGSKEIPSVPQGLFLYHETLMSKAHTPMKTMLWCNDRKGG